MSNSQKKIVIIDFGLGNLFSVYQACLKFGHDVRVSSSFNDIDSADGIILPGVGAFAIAMENLQKLNLISKINQLFKEGRPIMGICLGLQLLFEESNEFGTHQGLGILKGKVERLPEHTSLGEKLRVPHIGWGQLNFMNRELKSVSPLASLDDGSYMYFVHSYFVRPADEKIVLTTTNFGGMGFCSSVIYENLFAVQFHPEKSGELGLNIYKAWMERI